MLHTRLILVEGPPAVSEKLYAHIPFPKLQIHNPSQDWPAAMRQMLHFLELPAHLD